MSDSTSSTSVPSDSVAMTQATATAALQSPEGTDPKWAKFAIAVFAMAMLAGVVGYAVIAKDHDAMMLCIGAVISMAVGASNYYLGSSSDSNHKTNLLAAAPPTQLSIK